MAVTRKALERIGVIPVGNLPHFANGVTGHLSEGGDTSRINNDQTLLQVFDSGQLVAVTVRGTRYDLEPANA